MRGVRRGYAADTSVPSQKTRGEIETLLSRHSCAQYGTAVDYGTGIARVQFRAHDRIVRFEISLPKQDQRNREQIERQRWRQLLLVIKAKLESVENNIATFEEEFLAHIILPNDQTVASVVLPLIGHAYKTGKMPTALALPARGETN